MILSRQTGRFLFVQRTQERTAGKWGFAGGKQEPHDKSPLDTLRREMMEELGEMPPIMKILPLDLFTSNDKVFRYGTYVVLVDDEFIPVLNHEHSGFAWCDYGCWPNPLHCGVRASLNSKIVREKLQIILSMIE